MLANETANPRMGIWSQDDALVYRNGADGKPAHVDVRADDGAIEITIRDGVVSAR